jgi:hypothetical protein
MWHIIHLTQYCGTTYIQFKIKIRGTPYTITPSHMSCLLRRENATDKNRHIDRV